MRVILAEQDKIIIKFIYTATPKLTANHHESIFPPQGSASPEVADHLQYSECSVCQKLNT